MQALDALSDLMENKKHSILSNNYMLINSSFNDVNFDEIRARIRRCTRIMLSITVDKYTYNKMKDTTPNNAAIAKANSLMHKLEIDYDTNGPSENLRYRQNVDRRWASPVPC